MKDDEEAKLDERVVRWVTLEILQTEMETDMVLKIIK